jgi:hypothetical protein
MSWCEAIIAQGAPNSQTLALAAVAPTSLTTRTGYGKPKITHALQLCVNDNVNDCWVLPAGFADPNGVPVEASAIYGAVNGFDMEESKLSSPVEVPENCMLQIFARNETAVASQVFVWLMLEYPGAGPFAEVTKSKPIVRRAWEHGAALVSLTVADSTPITDLQPGRTYQIAGVGNAAINAATAGIVGPAFFGVGANHSAGAEWFVPLINAGGYQVGGGPSFVDFYRCGIKSPMISGGQPLRTRCVGFTAEQPQAVLAMAVDKVFA